jgi:hypothetical protein
MSSPLQLSKVLIRTLHQLRLYVDLPVHVSSELYALAQDLCLHKEESLDILGLDPAACKRDVVIIEESELEARLCGYLSAVLAGLLKVTESDGPPLLAPYLQAREVLSHASDLPIKSTRTEESKAWQPLQDLDPYRLPGGHSYGGLALTDQEVLAKLRRVGKELIYRIGKKILSGSLNLTTISFPIACMQGNTALHNSLRAAALCPLYLTKAAACSSFVERLKLVVTATVCSFASTSTFLKPVFPSQLNPILGETLTAETEDGTVYYAEQTCHHPPVSSVLIIGPNDCYRVSGNYCFESHAGLNSLTVTNTGHRTITFLDQVITHNCPTELFSGTFIGTLRHESLGVLTFLDEGHDLKCELRFTGQKGKPSDYFMGTVTEAGRELCTVSGTYLGFMDFGNERYWDSRYIEPFPMQFVPVLPSDSEYREDLVQLRRGNEEEAQAAKEALEELQRNDRQLRAKWHSS